MSELRPAVLATIIFYDALSMPLTRDEVHRFLINPARLSHIPKGLGVIRAEDIQKVLEELCDIGTIVRSGDYYMVRSHASLADIRMQRSAVAQKKWIRFLSVSRWLLAAPFIEGMFASGSLAMDNTDDESDFDVLVIARSGRLYTCRVFLWLISSLLGARRGRFEDVAPDKLCFNHFITHAHPRIVHESLFTAHTYARLRPLFTRGDVGHVFYAANAWINTYLYHFKPRPEDVRSVTIISGVRWCARICEWLLSGRMGDGLERMVRTYQHRRIEKNPVTYESGGRIVWNDTELEFHPRSFEKTVLMRYKSGLLQAGIQSYTDEKDSGLRA